MPSDHQNPGAKPPGSGRRPPTIDLVATEVEGEAQQQANARQGDPAADPSSQAGRKPHVLFRLVAPALWAAFGACLVLAFGAALWWSGLVKPAGSDDDLSARLAQIERQLRAAPQTGPSPDAKMLGDILARLAKIETTLSAPAPGDPALAGGVARAEAAAKAAADEVASLRGRLDEMTALVRDAQRRADAAASAAESAQRSSQSTTAELARAAQPDDRGSRLAIAANALRAAVERGEPFVAELTAARSLAPDADRLAALEPFAAGGIVSASALARDLTALIPALLRAGLSLAPDAGFLEKLQANAERIVRVRPVGEAGGHDPASAVARIESRAARADIEGALAELKALPEAIRAPADGWIRTAEQRAAAIAASRQFAREALLALGKPSL
jgi:hypothetical protein